MLGYDIEGGRMMNIVHVAVVSWAERRELLLHEESSGHVEDWESGAISESELSP